MQLEVDHLKKKLRHARRKRTPLTLMVPLMIERMLVIDEGQEHHLASLSPTSLSPMMRSTITKVGIRARLAKAWEMTL